MNVECTGSIDLKKVESIYKLLFECARDMVFLVDMNGKILDVNYAAVKEYGYTRDEMMSMTVNDLRSPGQRGSIEKNFNEAFAHGAIYETIHMRKNGSEFPVEVSSRGLILDEKKMLIAIVRDITKRKEAERNLARIAAIVESSDDAILGMTLDGIIMEWNRGAEKMYGYTAKEMLGRSVEVLIPKDRAGELSHIIEVIKQGGRLEHFDTVRITKDKKPVIVSLNASPIIDSNGELLGISWTARDITERKKIEDVLHESERRFRGIYEQAPLGIAVIDSITGRFLQVNPKYTEIIGRTEDEMKKTTFMAISHPDNLQKDLDNMARLLSGEIHSFNMIKRLFRGDGSIIWVNLTVVPLWEDSEREYPKSHIAMVEDITEKKMVEEKLAHVASFPELNPDPIIEIDDRGAIIFSNPAANRLFPDLVSKGLSHQILKGLSFRKGDFGKEDSNRLVRDVQINGVFYQQTIVYMPELRTTRIYSTDITQRKRAEQKLRESEEMLHLAQRVAHVGAFEWNIQTGVDKWTPELEAMYGLPKGGFPGTHEAWKRLVYHEDRAEAVRRVNEAMDKGNFEGEWRVVWPDGTIHWHYARGRVFKDESGKPLKLVGVNIDITERKKMEDALENSKAQAELYLDLMGHDINNMNQVAMGFLELALESFHLTDEERKFLEKPLDTLKNSATLIENVRKLQKLEEGSLKYRKIDLCNILKEVKDDYSHIPGRSVTINFMPIPHCYVVANEFINDVFANLVGNAIKHTDPQKPLIIDMGLELVREKGKNYYKVIVEDNGPGVPDELKSKLFMRFQRGKTKASGKGLGLYLVRTLVTDFHGKIWVEDRVPGDYTKGSRFVVMLPVAAK